MVAICDQLPVGTPRGEPRMAKKMAVVEVGAIQQRIFLVRGVKGIIDAATSGGTRR